MSKLNYHTAKFFCEDILAENSKLCYMDTDSIRVYIKTEDIYKEITKDVEAGFDTLNNKFNKWFPKRKKWKSDWFSER